MTSTKSDQTAKAEENSPNPREEFEKLPRISPLEFKRELLSHLGNTYKLLIHDGCFPMIKKNTIMLWNSANSPFVLSVTYRDIWKYDGNPTETSFRQITYKINPPNAKTNHDNKNTTAKVSPIRIAFSSNLPKQASAASASSGDVFLPLGWLSERALCPPSPEPRSCPCATRKTRYAAMLNISTDPISLWLVFDYYTRFREPSDEEWDSEAEEESCRDHIARGVPQSPLAERYQLHYDAHWHHHGGKNDIYVRDPETLEMGKEGGDWIGERDIVCLYRDVGTWDPRYVDAEEWEKGSDPVNLEGCLLGDSLQTKLCEAPQELIDAQTKGKK